MDEYLNILNTIADIFTPAGYSLAKNIENSIKADNEDDKEYCRKRLDYLLDLEWISDYVIKKRIEIKKEKKRIVDDKRQAEYDKKIKEREEERER